jgi:monofunctional biosynthetic peptidoglycan transglycosylase
MSEKSKITFLTKVKALFKALFKYALFSILISIVGVSLLNWINPATSSTMIQRQMQSFLDGEFKIIKYIWTYDDDISPEMQIAIIAAEDQNFPNHFGFDFDQIEKAIEQHNRGKRLRGASTITQQVAKNLFLWEGKSFIRKGVEAYFTVLIELLWSKKRILEVYLNIAELGDLIFGVEAASIIYFNKTANKLSRSQSALLAATLPNPLRYSASHPSDYILRRQHWIMQQMNALGGRNYLKDL